MRILLDTHTFIWFVTDSSRLSTTAKALIENDYNEKLLSIASIWEMSIKHSIGKLTFELPFMTFAIALEWGLPHRCCKIVWRYSTFKLNT